MRNSLIYLGCPFTWSVKVEIVHKLHFRCLTVVVVLVLVVSICIGYKSWLSRVLLMRKFLGLGSYEEVSRYLTFLLNW